MLPLNEPSLVRSFGTAKPHDGLPFSIRDVIVSRVAIRTRLKLYLYSPGRVHGKVTLILLSPYHDEIYAVNTRILTSELAVALADHKKRTQGYSYT